MNKSHFILIKADEETTKYAVDVLKMLLGNNSLVEENCNFTCIFHNGCDSKEIIDVIKSLESDLNTSISVYVSSQNSTNEELNLISNHFNKISYGYYTFKELLYKSKNIENSQEILNYILEGSGITTDTIIGMAKCNLNVSKAALALYMHRNTLLYKIDRLISTIGFDLKNFLDVYILLRLIEA